MCNLEQYGNYAKQNLTLHDCKSTPTKAITYINSNFKEWEITEIEKKGCGYKIEVIFCE